MQAAQTVMKWLIILGVLGMIGWAISSTMTAMNTKNHDSVCRQGNLTSETTNRAMVGRGEAEIQTKKFTEKQGVVDTLLNLVVTQTIPSL